jgi:hypothetical protein
MSFLFPLFLLALLAIAIPIIIHLFNFKRYKTLYFSNVQLLKRIKQESKKKSQLKQLLILLSRILAIACLVLAFSRPYLPSGNRTARLARQIVEIYIDNSFSMKAVGEKGPLLEQAKQKAIEIANSYPVGTQFLIKTNDFIPGSQYPMNKEQFIRQVSEIDDSPLSPMLADIYTQSVNAIESSAAKAEKTLFILSDFQKGNANLEAIKPDSSVWTYLIPFKAEKINNLLIDSCWFEVPGRKIGQAEKLYVRIKNLSAQAYQNVPVRLTVNDSLKAVSNINIEAGQQLIQELNYTNNSQGIQLCKVDLDDYPIIFDNSYFLSYQVRGKLRALGIGNVQEGRSDYLKALFSDDDLIGYDEVAENNVQVSQLKNYQCIFLINNQTISSGLKSELSSYADDGGTLVIFPTKTSNYTDYNALLSALGGNLIAGFDTASVNISEINYNHELYHDVFKKQESEADLPKIKGYVSFSSQMLNTETSILKFRNGKNALSSHSTGKGTVYTFAFPLNQDNFNFVRHMIFVPTLYNMVLYSGEPQKYAYSTESEEPVVLNSNRNSGEITLVNLITNEKYKTSVRNFGTDKKQLVLDDLPKDAGHYLVKDGNETIQSISYNYPRKESVPEFLNEKDLHKMLQSKAFKQFQLIENPSEKLSEAVQDLSTGRQLWKYFIALALFFVLCEMAIIRFWKN